MPTPAAKHPREVLAVLLLATSTYALAQTFIVPAIPAIAEQTGVGPATSSWLLTGFLLSAAVCTPISGKLGDVHGKGRALAAVMVLFSLGSLLGALAGDSIELLIAGRVLQGVGGGVFPLAFGIVRDTFPPRLVAGGLSIVSTLFGIGAGLGLPLSGVIVDNLGFAWLFWLCLGMGGASIVAGLTLVPPTPKRTSGTAIDWTGALLLAGALATILLGITQAHHFGWASAETAALLAGGMALLAAWLRVSSRRREPLIELRLLRQRSVAATNAAALCIGFPMFVAFLLVPQIAQADGAGGLGLTATQAGLLILPSALVQLAFGPIAAYLGARVGFRTTLFAGALGCTVSVTMLIFFAGHVWDYVVSGAVLGAGIALAYAGMANLIVDAVPQRDVGIATGINTVTRTVGGALGVAVATALIGAGSLGVETIGSGYRVAFAIAAGTGVLAMLAAIAIPRQPVPRLAQATSAP